MGVDRRYPERDRRRGAAVHGGACELREQLRALDFALAEVCLYLDAYPNCTEALSYYHKLTEKRQAVAAALGDAGEPMTVRDIHSQTCWQWVKTPWPWEHEAN